MHENEKTEISRIPPAFRMEIELYRLGSGKQMMVATKGSRGVGITKSWDVTPGHPVTSALADMVTWVQKSLMDFFASWGRI